MDPRNPHVRHERRDVRPALVILAGFCIVLLLAWLHIEIKAAFTFLQNREIKAKHRPAEVTDHIPPGQTPGAPGGPRLQVNAPADLQALRAAEETVLHGYAWVDPQARIVRIPIERAMELEAQQQTEESASQPAPKQKREP